MDPFAASTPAGTPAGSRVLRVQVVRVFHTPPVQTSNSSSSPSAVSDSHLASPPQSPPASRIIRTSAVRDATTTATAAAPSATAVTAVTTSTPTARLQAPGSLKVVVTPGRLRCGPAPPKTLALSRQHPHDQKQQVKSQQLASQQSVRVKEQVKSQQSTPKQSAHVKQEVKSPPQQSVRVTKIVQREPRAAHPTSHTSTTSSSPSTPSRSPLQDSSHSPHIVFTPMSSPAYRTSAVRAVSTAVTATVPSATVVTAVTTSAPAVRLKAPVSMASGKRRGGHVPFTKLTPARQQQPASQQLDYQTKEVHSPPQTPHQAIHQKQEVLSPPRTPLQPVHQTQENKRESYKCPSCPAQFDKEGYRRAHVRSRHTKSAPPGEAPCPLCSLNPPDKPALRRHLFLCHRRARVSCEYHQCPICPSRYMLKYILNRHIRVKHPDHPKPSKPEFYLCSSCPAQFRSEGYLRAHVRSKHTESASPDEPELHECGICSARYKMKHTLDRHVRMKHPQEALLVNAELYQCPKCPLRYEGKHSRNEHIRRKHPGTLIPNGNVGYGCELCDWRGSTRRAMHQHTQRVHIRHTGRARCMNTGCSFSSKRISDLRDHLSSVHGEVCDVITMQFNNLEAFFEWRSQHEMENEVRFPVYSRQADALSLYCQRSCRPATSNGGHVRFSISTGRLCTASMRVRLTDKDPTLPVRVRACLHHHGHDSCKDLIHHSYLERSRFIKKIRAGVPRKKIREEDMNGLDHRLVTMREAGIFDGPWGRDSPPPSGTPTSAPPTSGPPTSGPPTSGPPTSGSIKTSAVVNGRARTNRVRRANSNREREGPPSCLSCGLQFRSWAFKHRHMREIHNDIFDEARCLEDGCTFKSDSPEELRDHLQNTHGQQHHYTDLMFDDRAAFESWLRHSQQVSGNRYERSMRTGAYSLYVCNRSGQYRPLAVRRGRVKDHRCTSEVRVEMRQDGVHARFWPQHYGHTKRVQRAPGPILDGAPPVEVLERSLRSMDETIRQVVEGSPRADDGNVPRYKRQRTSGADDDADSADDIDVTMDEDAQLLDLPFLWHSSGWQSEEEEEDSLEVISGGTRTPTMSEVLESRSFMEGYLSDCNRRSPVSSPELVCQPVMLEVCVDSVESAVAAERGGADRLELCAALSEGGLTPSAGLLSVVKQLVHIPVFVMIRPRAGDFVYSDAEVDVMLKDMEVLKQLGADGFVFGCLTDRAEVDQRQCVRLLSAVDPLPCTFHRALDLVSECDAALTMIKQLRFSRVLTSGQAASAPQGADVIAALVVRADGALTVMAGAGVTAENVAALCRSTGVREVHASARSVRRSRMKAAVVSSKSVVSMGCGQADTSSWGQCDPLKVRAIKAAFLSAWAADVQ